MLLDHLSEKESKTHRDATQYHHILKPVRKRESLVVKNQLRAALTAVKTKSAALHYETQIAQLFAAGADVGDYGHSRHMFVPMLKAACAYIDKEVSKLMSTPPPNTGMHPHFYATGDKTAQITKEKPSASASSRLHEHAEDIADFKYKNTTWLKGG